MSWALGRWWLPLVCLLLAGCRWVLSFSASLPERARDRLDLPARADSADSAACADCRGDRPREDRPHDKVDRSKDTGQVDRSKDTGQVDRSKQTPDALADKRQPDAATLPTCASSYFGSTGVKVCSESTSECWVSAAASMMSTVTCQSVCQVSGRACHYACVPWLVLGCSCSTVITCTTPRNAVLCTCGP